MKRIINNNLCIGCGLCQSFLGEDKCIMSLENGFYKPHLIKKLSLNEIKSIYKLCPGVHVEANTPQSLWGDLLGVYESWSKDLTIRHKASSGGFVTSTAIFLLENGIIDGVLHVGNKKNNWLYNELTVSNTKEEIISKSQSRYAPALTLHNIIQILNKDKKKKYLFIGKPCDIAGIKNLLNLYPHYKKQIILTISIFCGGMPNYKSSEQIANLLKKTKAEPINIKYRGDGWPGECVVKYDDGTQNSFSYHYSWSKILSPTINFRCKICPDGIGLLADIAVGDSWNTKDGYPCFEEDDGRSLVFIRSKQALDYIKAAYQMGYIDLKCYTTQNMNEIQPAQFHKRSQMGIRILAAQLLTMNMLNFKNLCMYKHAIHNRPLEALKIFKGTINRYYKSKK